MITDMIQNTDKSNDKIEPFSSKDSSSIMRYFNLIEYRIGRW